MEILIQILLLVVGFVLLIKGADWFVDGSSGIATKFGIPQLVIGLTIVAMGTSAPEAAVSISAALKGNADITIGNIVGSNIFNILFVVGTSAVIIPVAFVSSFVIDCIVAILAGIVLWLCTFRKRKLTRTGGIIMLICYLAYFLYLLLSIFTSPAVITRMQPSSFLKDIVFAILASFIFTFGTKQTGIFSSQAFKTTGNTPCTPLMLPSRPTSPKNNMGSSNGEMNLEAIRMEIPIARSYNVPDFLKLAGARLTVIRFGGRR